MAPTVALGTAPAGRTTGVDRTAPLAKRCGTAPGRVMAAATAPSLPMVAAFGGADFGAVGLRGVTALGREFKFASLEAKAARVGAAPEGAVGGYIDLLAEPAVGFKPPTPPEPIGLPPTGVPFDGLIPPPTGAGRITWRGLQTRH